MKEKRATYFFINKWGTYSANFFAPLKANATYGTIVFVHGFRAKKEWYSWIGECLANQGYSALLFTVPSSGLLDPYQWSDGIKSAIDYLLNKESALCDIVTSENIGVMGHSMGGLGALIATSEDLRIKCTVGLAPAILPEVLPLPREINNTSTPIQLQIGSKDGLIPTTNVKTFFRSLNTKKSYIEIEGGNHIRFMDKTASSILGEYMSRFGLIGRQLKDQEATITFEAQHLISSNNFLEWFSSNLN